VFLFVRNSPRCIVQFVIRQPRTQYFDIADIASAVVASTRIWRRGTDNVQFAAKSSGIKIWGRYTCSNPGKVVVFLLVALGKTKEHNERPLTGHTMSPFLYHSFSFIWLLFVRHAHLGNEEKDK
jgi:hypothetical protein